MTDTDENPTKTDNANECRACLVKIDINSGCLDLFRSWDPPWSGMGLSIAEDLGKLANIKISVSDTFSRFICKKCCVRLRYACNFARIVKNTDIILRRRLRETSKTPSWPKPIQVDNIASAYRNQINVEIKQEVMSEDEDLSDTELSNPELSIKVEPEEIQEPFEIEINLSGRNQQKHTNGPENLDGVMLIDVKDEPMSDEETESDHSLPTECMLCSKPFNTRSGLKAHVIAFHSYDTVTSPRVDRHICATCKRSFATRTDLCVHETCHSQYACYACDKKFDTFVQLTRHRTKDCMKDDTLPRLKTLDDVVRPLPIFYIPSKNTNNVKSEAQKSQKKADDTNKPEFYSSLRKPDSFENVPTFVSQEDTNLGSTSDTNLGSVKDTNSGISKDTNIGAPKDSLKVQIHQKLGSQEVNTPETLSYPTAITPIQFPATNNTETSRSSDKIESGNDVPVQVYLGEKPIQSSNENNPMQVDSESKSNDETHTIHLTIQISKETDPGLEQLESKNNDHAEENKVRPVKSSSTEETSLDLENSSKANPETEEIININIEEKEKTSFVEKTSSDLENDSITNTRTEQAPDINIDSEEIAPVTKETYDSVTKMQQLRVTSPIPVAKECENNTTVDDITQPNQVLEFKSTDENVESNGNNDIKESKKIKTISNTQQSQEPTETLRVHERSRSPDFNNTAEKDSDKSNTRKEEVSEYNSLLRIIKPENKEPNIDFERNLSDVYITSISNKTEGNLESNEIIKDSKSINSLPTIETKGTNSEEIIRNTVNIERATHKESMDLENRPKEIRQVENEPSEISMEVESPQEKGMEIQLEIHSVEKEQDFMDVDSEFDSELKINNSESDSQNAQ